MGGVAKFLQSLGECDLVEGQAVGLPGPNDGVLQASVDLVPIELMMKTVVVNCQIQLGL